MLRVKFSKVFSNGQATLRGKYRQYNPEALDRAYEAVIDGMSVRKAAKSFSVPFATLRDHTSGEIGVECQKSGPDPLLSMEEERQLVLHIQTMANIGFGYTRSEVTDLATDLAIHVGKRHKDDKPLSMQWFYNFLSRWPDLKVLKPRSLELHRAKATSKETVGHYFQELERILDKYNLKNSPHHIYNVDEKGIVENHNPPSVVSSSENTPYAVTNPRSNTTTIIGCGSASGALIPPFFIFKGKRMREEYLEGSTPGTSGTVSDSGWSNTEVFHHYLEHHFLKHSVTATPDNPVLVLYDGHRSHVSLSLISWARQQNIILFVLPAHTSHVLQPMDVGCFGPFSRIYNNLRHKYMRDNSISSIGKNSLCELACRSYSLASTPSNLQSSFKACGIHPFASNAVHPINFAPSTVYSMQCSGSENLKEHTETSEDKTEDISSFFRSKISVLNEKSRPTKKRKVLSSIVGGKAITEDDIMEKVAEHKSNHPSTKEVKNSKTTSKKKIQSKSTPTVTVQQPIPSTSGIEVRRQSDSVSSDSDSDITDDEVCCQCNKFTPEQLRGCRTVVFVSWAQCTHPSCSHWVHLKLCTPVRVVRSSDEFWCPCHREPEE